MQLLYNNCITTNKFITDSVSLHLLCVYITMKHCREHWYPLLRKSIWHVPSASAACCIRSFWDASLASQKLFLCQLKTKVFKEPFLITLHCTIQCPRFNLIQLRQITVQHYLLISDCIYQISSSLLSNAKGDRAYAFSPPFPSEVYHS